MKLSSECIPCILQQSIRAARIAGASTEQEKAIVDDVVRMLLSVGWDENPALATTFAHNIVKEKVGNQDPFKKIKEAHTEWAKGVYLSFEEKIKKSPDPLNEAALLAVAANGIDMGVKEHVDVEEVLKDVKVKVWHLQSFKEALKKSKSILYILDNVGEAYFDFLFAIILKGMGKELFVAAKTAPILNDATIEDAKDIGFCKIAKVVGATDSIGTPLNSATSEFKALFKSCDIVMSKGQGNYETLKDEKKKNLFFLFQAKCALVAKTAHVDIGDALLLKGDEA